MPFAGSSILAVFTAYDCLKSSKHKHIGNRVVTAWLLTRLVHGFVLYLVVPMFVFGTFVFPGPDEPWDSKAENLGQVVKHLKTK